MSLPRFCLLRATQLAALRERQGVVAAGADAQLSTLAALRAHGGESAAASAVAEEQLRAAVEATGTGLENVAAAARLEASRQAGLREELRGAQAALAARVAEAEGSLSRRIEIAVADARAGAEQSLRAAGQGEEAMQSRLTAHDAALHARLEAMERAVEAERADRTAATARAAREAGSQLEAAARSQSHELLVRALLLALATHAAFSLYLLLTHDWLPTRCLFPPSSHFSLLYL